MTSKGEPLVITGSPIASGNLRRLAVVVLAVLSLAMLDFIAPALAAEEVEEEPAQVVAETEAADEDVEEGSAWYPPATAGGAPQGGTGAVKIEDPGTVTDPEKAAETGKKPPSAEWVFAPIPFANPTIGTGLILGIGYVFPIDENDPDSPPSTIGLGGMYSSNGSKALGGGARTYFDEDRYRIAGGLAAYDVGYDFFGTGNEAGDRGFSIPVRQRGGAFQIEYLQLWRDDIYLGGSYAFSEARISLDADLAPPLDILPNEFRSTTGAIGLRAERDTRNSTFYPTDGIFLVAGIDFYGDIWGSDFTYQAYEIAYNTYQPLNEQAILASRAYMRQTAGDVPFYGLSLFGSHGDLRGYTAGQYRDNFMIAIQTEYRVTLKNNFGYVVFAGVGEVASRLGELNFDDILPSGGVGLRYTLAEENHINMRVDFAYGKSGGAIYFGVGEAF